MAHFVLDLTASVATVLALGWLFQTSANEYALRNVLITQNEIYVAISRFTPANLLFSYAHTAAQEVRGLVLGYDVADNFSAIMRAGLLAVGQLVLELAIAVPRTLFELYQETSGTAAWIVLAGFGMAASAVSTTLLTARVSVWRLLLAAAMCPLAISVVFLGLQGFMVLMLSAFFWLTTLAPYAVACPVLCTLVLGGDAQRRTWCGRVSGTPRAADAGTAGVAPPPSASRPRDRRPYPLRGQRRLVHLRTQRRKCIAHGIGDRCCRRDRTTLAHALHAVFG